MARRSNMYGKNKRQKELKRQKKQAEKQLRRQSGKTSAETSERTDAMHNEFDTSSRTSEVMERKEEKEPINE